MEDAAEDSDATVAGDETEANGDIQLKRTESKPRGAVYNIQAPLNMTKDDECSDSNETAPSSPSLLQSVQHLSLNQTIPSHTLNIDNSMGLSIKVNNKSEMDQNTNTNTESTAPCDEGLSLPVLHYPTSTTNSSTTTSNTPCTASTHNQHLSASLLTPQTPSLDDIVSEQNALLSQLNISEGITETVVEEAKRSASRIEQALKTISLCNQAERKRLASKHALLLSESQSQSSGTCHMSEGTQSIRTQLLGLAAKQKQLLQCFVKQKDISNQLSKVLQTMHRPSTTHGGVQQTTKHCLTAVTQNTTKIPSTRQSDNIQAPSTCMSTLSMNSRSGQAHSSSVEQTPSQTQTKLVTSGSSSSSKAPVNSSDLSHPVPLKTLMDHGLIQPGRDCLSCAILGCEFKASLSTDATIISQNSSKYELPQQWVKSCWARLGHPNRIVKRKSIYSSVLYKGIPLLHFCEKYILKQVSSYLSQNKHCDDDIKEMSHPQALNEHTSVATGPKVGPSLLPQTYVATRPSNACLSHSLEHFNITRILTSGSVFVHHCGAHKQTSLELAKDFWEGKDIVFSPDVFQQVKYDLEW